jgi:signal transduction histidine kinase
MKKLILSFVFFTNLAFAQNQYLDSLKNWINTHPKEDSLRVVNLHRISYRLSEIDITEAWQYAFATYQLAQKLQNPVSIGQSYINYALLESTSGDYVKSLEHYQMAIKQFESSNWQRGFAIVYNNMGENYKKLEQFDKCLEYSQKALAINQTIKHIRGQAVNLELLASVYFLQKKYSNSMDYANKGLKLCTDNGMEPTKAQLLIDIANIHLALEDYEKAHDFFEQALEIGNRLNEKLTQLICHKEMAKMNRLQKEFSQSEVHIVKAELLAKDLKADHEMMAIQFEKYLNFRAQGLFELALNTYQVFIELTNQNASKKSIIKAEILDLKFKNSNHIKENNRLEGIKAGLEEVSLKKSNWIILLAFLVLAIATLAVHLLYRYKLREINNVAKAQQETFRQMQIAENIKTQICQDLHDDLGATLSSIAMLTKAAKRKMATENTEVAALLGTIQATAQKSVSTIKDIIWTTNNMNDTFGTITTKMDDFAQETLKPSQVSYELNIDNQLSTHHLPANQQYHFYLIFKEAINNIAKYAQANKVVVNLFEEQNKLVMKIADDGIGFDVSNRKAHGNGLLNIESRVSAMEGSYHIVSEIGQGTTMTLSLPIA